MPSLPPEPGSEPQVLSSLPGTESEAKSIAHLLSAQPLIGSEANKANILARISDVGIIHFATHGLLDNFWIEGVIPGALALTPEVNVDDGFHRADEIFGLNLRSEIAVLSACDTGRGSINSDGVVGLSRSFLAAGVPAVIVSLWSVPDTPTELLMTNFYQNWQEDEMDKVQALRQAMLKTMNRYPHPRDWAAFTFIGAE